MYAKYFSIFILVNILCACGGGSSGTSGNSTPPTPVPTNNPPVANDDAFDIFVNDIQQFDVISNDSDSNGDALTITSTTAPTAGQVEIVENQLQYTPNSNFIGRDTFSYTLSDGNSGTDSAVVTININNRPPTTFNDAYITFQSQAIEFEPLENDSSSAFHELVIVNLTTPANGQVALLNNVVTYAPTPGYVGQDSFAYTVRDSVGDEATASIAITVNNVIPIATDDTAVTQQNNSVDISPLLNDIDAIGDVISVAGNTLPTNGSVTLLNNIFTYTPIDGYSGPDNFTYTLVDSYGQTESASISIDVINRIPIAADDSSKTLVNNSVEINVIDNDSDVAGDSISIVSVSAPLNGVTSVIGNVITYQPNLDFSGDDLFGYTIEDRYGANTSGFVYVQVLPGIKLRGKIIGQDIEGVEVTFSYGEKQVSTSTDETGSYEVIIDTFTPLAIVSAAAAHPTAEYTYKAYFDDVNSLLAQIDTDFVLDNINLSNLSTAEFELINVINNTNTVNDLATLYSLRAQLVPTYQLEGAVSAALVYNANGIELPEPYTTINQLLGSPFEMRDLLSVWREQFPGEYYAAFEAVFSDDGLTSAPDGISTGNTLFQQGTTNLLLLTTNGLTLKDNNQGHYLRAGITKGEFTWQRTEQLLDIDFLQPFRTLISNDRYCGTNDATSINFDATNMQYRHLYTTGKYDVFMRKYTGEFEDSDCLDKSVHTSEYDAISVYQTSPLQIEAGQYYLENVRRNEESEGNADAAYHRVSSLFELDNDGSFNENIADMTEPRAGQWSVLENTLILDYLDGFVVSYNLISAFDAIPVLSYQTLEDNELAAAGHTFMIVKDSSFASEQTDGKYANVENALFDTNIDGSFRLNFDSDNTGSQSSFSFGSWGSPSSSVFSWAREGNVYTATYYIRPETNQRVSFCDTNEVNCSIWRQRSFEVIGAQNNYFMIKNYQELYDDFGISSRIRAGYIGLFSFESN